MLHHSFVLRYSFAQVPFCPLLFHYSFVLSCSSMLHYSFAQIDILPPRRPLFFYNVLEIQIFNLGVWHEAWKHQVPSWWKQ